MHYLQNRYHMRHRTSPPHQQSFNCPHKAAPPIKWTQLHETHLDGTCHKHPGCDSQRAGRVRAPGFHKRNVIKIMGIISGKLCWLYGCDMCSCVVTLHRGNPIQFVHGGSAAAVLTCWRWPWVARFCKDVWFVWFHASQWPIGGPTDGGLFDILVGSREVSCVSDWLDTLP